MKARTNSSGIIEAPVDVDGIRKTYSWMSKIYFLAAPLEKRARMRGIELAGIKPDDHVLEVAVGTGLSFIEILKRVNHETTVNGIDLTPAMVLKTRKLAARNGFTNFHLQEGDTRHLPFPDENFNVLYNSYMLDLVPLNDFPAILHEFCRVLKKGGRLVLVNLTKKDGLLPAFYENLYRFNPYLFGGCRPVLMASYVSQAGFSNVMREGLDGFLPSEIVTAIK